MGADFLERAKKTIKRSWDRERVALATSDLLTRQPNCVGRSVVGEIMNGATVAPGEKLTVERDADGLIARRGLTGVDLAQHFQRRGHHLRPDAVAGQYGNMEAVVDEHKVRGIPEE
jgi:hypothetical protein